MNKSLPLIVIAAVSVAACKKPEDRQPSTPPPAAAASDAQTASNAAATQELSPSPAAPMLALAYRLGLVVPADQVRPLMESHQEACERAGADQCQVMAANASAEGDDRTTAELTLRATPAWMRMFRTRAEADAKDLGGRIDEAATQADDLSTNIVDTEAAQNARAAERQRLTELMRRRTRDLDQTLKVEQAITQVQSDMDQASSELAAMKGRVVMQTVTVSYESAAAAAPRGSAAPLQAAERDFLGNVYAVAAVLLTLASFVLPFALIGAPIAWWMRRRRRVKASAAVADA